MNALSALAILLTNWFPIDGDVIPITICNESLSEVFLNNSVWDFSTLNIGYRESTIEYRAINDSIIQEYGPECRRDYTLNAEGMWLIGKEQISGVVVERISIPEFAEADLSDSVSRYGRIWQTNIMEEKGAYTYTPVFALGTIITPRADTIPDVILSRYDSSYNSGCSSDSTIYDVHEQIFTWRSVESRYPIAKYTIRKYSSDSISSDYACCQFSYPEEQPGYEPAQPTSPLVYSADVKGNNPQLNDPINVTVSGDKIDIAIDVVSESPFRLLLCDIAGRVYYVSSKAANSYSVPAGNLPPGTYIAVVEQGDMSFTHKFILK